MNVQVSRKSFIVTIEVLNQAGVVIMKRFLPAVVMPGGVVLVFSINLETAGQPAVEVASPAFLSPSRELNDLLKQLEDGQTITGESAHNIFSAIQDLLVGGDVIRCDFPRTNSREGVTISSSTPSTPGSRDGWRTNYREGDGV